MDMRDVIITIGDLSFRVTVTTDGKKGKLRRWHTRMYGSKQEIDEVLDAGVLSEIDRRVKLGEFDENVEAPAPFDMVGYTAKVLDIVQKATMRGLELERERNKQAEVDREQEYYDSYMADFHPNQNIVKVTK